MSWWYSVSGAFYNVFTQKKERHLESPIHELIHSFESFVLGMIEWVRW